MMLRYLGEKEAANRVEDGIAAVVAEGENVTYDLLPENRQGYAVGTSQVADAIIEKMQ